MSGDEDGRVSELGHPASRSDGERSGVITRPERHSLNALFQSLQRAAADDQYINVTTSNCNSAGRGCFYNVFMQAG